MSTKKELSPIERARKNAEYNHLKDRAVSIVDAMSEAERQTLVNLCTKVMECGIADAQYYETGTFYHVMDAMKHAYYVATKPARETSEATIAPIIAKPVKTYQPSEAGTIVSLETHGTPAQSETPAIVPAKPARKARASANALQAVQTPAIDETPAFVTPAMLQEINARMLADIVKLLGKV